MNLKEIYESCLKEANQKNVLYDVMNIKPTVKEGIISSNSKVSLNDAFNANLIIDKESIFKIIDIFEEIRKTESDNFKNELSVICIDIYKAIQSFLGSTSDMKNRMNEYLKGDVLLSSMEGKNVGACVEKASIAHQLFTILENAGILNYKSYFVESSIIIDSKDYPHAFVILENNTNNNKRILFDITNPIKLKKNDKVINSMGLYALLPDEFNSFMNGGKISPDNLYYSDGYRIVGDNFSYGSSFQNLFHPNI